MRWCVSYRQVVAFDGVDRLLAEPFVISPEPAAWGTVYTLCGLMIKGQYCYVDLAVEDEYRSFDVSNLLTVVFNELEARQYLGNFANKTLVLGGKTWYDNMEFRVGFDSVFNGISCLWSLSVDEIERDTGKTVQNGDFVIVDLAFWFEERSKEAFLNG